MAGIGKRDPEMQEFWASLPPKVKSSLWHEDRRLVLSSDEVPLQMVHQSRYKTTPKFYLFDDTFVVLQGTTVTEYPLQELWIQHIVPGEGILQSVQNISSFKLVFPESCLELQCKDLSHKSRWVSNIAEALGISLNLPQFITGRGDLSLDTQLELLRGREHMEYTFHLLPDYKEGRYKGQWRNAKPHGSGQFSQEKTGRLYKGGFGDGKFHGKGEMHWFPDRDAKKKYIGEFRAGELEGRGEMKYSNGDVYSGRWVKSQRSGYGRLVETAKKGSFYSGSWENDKRNGYGIYEDKMKHERYLGTWVEDVHCGPGMLVTSAGTYCEATFANGTIATGSDGFVINPDGRSFMGKLGPDLKLCGKGILTLNNGTVLEGTFGGQWHKKLEISKGLLEEPGKGRKLSDQESARADIAELQIAKLDRRIGNCTILARNKWQPIFADCESALGFSGDAANDVLSAWSKLASDTFQKRKGKQPDIPVKARRSHSLNRVQGMSVLLPVELIPLERARALTYGTQFQNGEEDWEAELALALKSTSIKKSLSRSSDMIHEILRPTSPTGTSSSEREDKPVISGPLNLEESVSVSNSSPSGDNSRIASVYAPQADRTSPVLSQPYSYPEESVDFAGLELSVEGVFDTSLAIQKYVDKAFNTPNHPLGSLMSQLEVVFNESYGGIGANKYLLPHAIAETHSIIRRIHSIVRILFPCLGGNDQHLSRLGFMRLEGASDPDDYVSIESGYSLLHPLVFMRLFPTLIPLYVLHHEEGDRRYQKGVELLKEMDNDRLVHYVNFPSPICEKIAGKQADGNILKALDEASNSLRIINSLFTPGDFLEHFKQAFCHLSNIEQLSGDFLLPAVVFILVRANAPHLGAYLHFLTDFAYTEPEDDYTLVTYEAAYNFIRRHAPGF